MAKKINGKEKASASPAPRVSRETSGAIPQPTDAQLRQPISEVIWRHRSLLNPNDYNPNSVAPPEMKLLVTSIMEDGWTQPIVINSAMEIVDGFHRWTVSGQEPLLARFNGWVPTVMVALDPAHQKMSTIRHNRARGTHAVLRMAEIVRGMLEGGVKSEDIQKRLGMEDEEVDRLRTRAGMPERMEKAGTFGKAWVPKGKA